MRSAILLLSTLVGIAATEPRFATVNGVKLHYLDWGGEGEVLLFLTCLGGTAEDFEPLATPFTGQFHVLGLTRRGQGQSAKPESGYDNTTLVEDIRAFLDNQKIKRATLIGYSLAGNEITQFATLLPTPREKADLPGRRL